MCVYVQLPCATVFVCSGIMDAFGCGIDKEAGLFIFLLMQGCCAQE